MNRILVEIVERHADEAAFLWERRERACRSPLFDLEALADIDRRLQANLEGLVLAGDVGLQKSLDVLERGTRAELFTAVHVAAELGDALALARLLVIAEKARLDERAVISALAWLSRPRADRILAELLASECPPSLHRLGIAAHAARREDPGAALERALGSSDAALRARASRAVGQLGRRDLLPMLRAEVQSGQDGVQAWAAWSAVLLGDRGAGRVLWRVTEQGGPMASVACDLAVRCLAAPEAAALLEHLARSPETLPAALAGAAALGDPACVPWVLDVGESAPSHSRAAAWVYATITGATLEPPLAVRVPTVDPSDEQVASSRVDPCEDLPLPDSGALRSHWARARSGFTAGERRLGGRLINATSLDERLRAGVQPWRASAAVELALASGRGLFPVRAPAWVQMMISRLPQTNAPLAPSPRD